MFLMVCLNAQTTLSIMILKVELGSMKKAIPKNLAKCSTKTLAISLWTHTREAVIVYRSDEIEKVQSVNWIVLKILGDHR